MDTHTRKELLTMEAIEVYLLVLNQKKIKKFPDGFWQQPEAKANAEKCIRYLIEEILKWNEDDIKNKLSLATFHKNKLCGMMNALFNDSPYLAIDSAYPGKFKPWQLKYSSKNIINRDMAKKATKWLLEEELKWSDEEILNKLSNRVCKDYGMLGFITKIYNGSVFAMVNDAYPNRFKPWDLKVVPMSYWNEQTAVEALRYVIEEKLKLDEDELLKVYNFKFLKKHRLSGMCKQVYGKSPYAALNAAYPGKYKPWQLSNTPKNFWSDEMVYEAMYWLIYRELNISKEQALNLPMSVYIDNSLSGMLQLRFDNSVPRVREYIRMNM